MRTLRKAAIAGLVALCCGVTGLQVAPHRAGAATTDPYLFGSQPMAAPGALAGSGFAQVSVTVTDATTGEQATGVVHQLYLSLASPSSSASIGTATAYVVDKSSPIQQGWTSGNNCASNPPSALLATKLGSSPTSVLVSGNNGDQVIVCYQAPASLPTGGTDVLVAQNTSSGPTAVGMDAYSYASQASRYAFSPNPIAEAGTLAHGDQKALTATALDSVGAPIAGLTVNMSFSPATNSGTPSGGSATCGTTNLGTTPTGCTTDGGNNFGKIAVEYTAGSAPKGTDTITAQSPTGGPSATDTYNYLGVGSYQLTPTPIAPTGSLAASSTKAVTLTALSTGASPTPVPLATVYLSLTSATGGAPTGGATATCAGGPLTLSASPAPCETSASDGTIPISYSTPSSLTGTGGAEDLLEAQNKLSGSTVNASDSYSYSTVGAYAFAPAPIAAPGSLTAGQAAPPGTVTAETGPGGSGVSGAVIYLSLAGPGSATANCAGNSPAQLSLTTTPQACSTAGSTSPGQAKVSYTAPSTLPTSGTAAITAQDAATSPTMSAQDGYNFASQVVASFAYSPNPIAASQSLAANQQRPVILTAKDTNGSAVPFGAVYLWETQTSGGGTASASGCGLLPTSQSSAIQCSTDSSGTVQLTYRAPATLPTSGEDAIEAQNASGTGPTVGPTSDDYSYGPIYVFSPSPMAPTGSLGPSQTVTVTVTEEKTNGGSTGTSPFNLSLATASGGQPAGTATATCGTSNVAVTSTPAACTPNSSGQATISYTTPSSLPTSGTDVLTAATQAPKAPYSNPAPGGTDSYSYKEVSSFAFQPDPIASSGSIPPGGSVPVTVSAFGNGGAPLANQTVYLSFSPTSGAGTAAVTQCGVVADLGSTPVACGTDSAGQVAVDYTAPSGATSGVVATITAEDGPTPSSSTTSLTDSYTVLQHFAFERLAGADRYSTAAAIAEAAFPSGAKTAIVATGTNFPDALAGAYLAGNEPGGAPVLLTDPASVPSVTGSALHTLGVTDVVILGGTGAVSDTVASTLTSDGYTVSRIAGGDRYQTMQSIDSQTVDAVGTVGGHPTAILATGDNFPDALGAGPIAYASHLPLVLTDGSQSALSGPAYSVLTTDKITQVVIVGGPSAINPGINNQLAGMGINVIEQAAGTDRSDTSAKLATWAVSQKLESGTVLDVANGCDQQGTPTCFTPDALAGAPFGGGRSPLPAPTLIADSPTDPAAVTSYATSNKSTLQVGYAFGGAAALGDSTLQTVASAAGG